jgi:pentatricopeptide repeat protein
LYEVARSKKIVLDSYFYAAVIEAAANARLWRRALGLLGEMEAEGIHPTDVIFRCVNDSAPGAFAGNLAVSQVSLLALRSKRVETQGNGKNLSSYWKR